MEAVTHLEKVITGEVSAVTHLEKVIAEETSAVTYTEKVIAGQATPITHLEKVIAGIASPVTHLEQVWAGGSPTPSEHEYTGAVPVTITANGLPLLDYLISGNMEQSSTPSPTTPIQPSETGDMSDNILTVYKENYSINASGVETYNNVAMIYKAEVTVTGSTFTLNFGGISAGDMVRIHAYTGNTWQEQVNAINIEQVPYSFTVGSNIDNIRISIRKTATDVAMTDGQYKIPISSANTTTPVYLGEVETTRKIRKLVMTGEESTYTSIDNARNIFSIRGVFNQAPDLLQVGGFCTHYKYNNAISSLAQNMSNGDFVLNKIADDYSFTIRDNSFSNDTDFKQYVQQQYSAGTPVCVWYVLAEPTTGIVNEPIRKIGNYADTVSMEQAGVSIPTNNGSTTVDVETTLKPSEVYIKYKG